MRQNGGRKRSAAAWRALAAVALIALSSPRLRAATPSAPVHEPPAAASAEPTTPVVPVEDQLATLYAKLQTVNDKIIDTQGRIADALDRDANLMGVALGVGVALLLLFAGLLLATRRTAKASTSAARALAMLERAYVFPGRDITVTVPDSVGPSAAVRITFHAGFTNHGRTPAVVRWINLDHHYLSEVPAGVYEDHARHGVGTVIGAGETLVRADSVLTIPRSEWERALAGDGAIYLDGRIVYRDIFAVQHETYFCWRYDIPGRAFVVVESEALNRYD
jgi:hypothetical protein